MKLGHLGLLALAMPLAAAAAATPANPLLIQARRAISSEMVDPGSLQYRNMRVIHAVVQGRALAIACGEYNSRNKMGGYTGFAKFAYEPTILHGGVSETADGDMEFIGDSSSAPTETSARVYGACVGVR